MPTRRAILHVDMDAFFASIEQLDQPALRGRPVLVGGAGARGVVAAASYEARAFGCRSAQPMALARRCCPHAAVVPPRGDRYREVSDRLLEILDSFTPLVEPLSIDEAFLDVTGSIPLHGPPRTIAQKIKARIAGELHLTASVGVADNKFLAKLASDLEKPDGLTVIEAGEVERILEALPIGRMWGVGPATEKRLRDLGVHTFGDLGRVPQGALERELGTLAGRICALARGEDHREVTPDGRAGSISQERTFDVDLTEPDAVAEELLAQVEQVAHRLRRHGFRARTATVKIRFGDFRTISRAATLDDATDRTDLLWSSASRLFGRWAGSSFRPVRLIGYRASGLTGSGPQLQLFTEETDERRRTLDRVTDAIREKFGEEAIHRRPRS